MLFCWVFRLCGMAVKIMFELPVLFTLGRKTMRLITHFGLPVVVILSVMVFLTASFNRSARGAPDTEGAAASESIPGPVDNMHHFMEYVFEPGYQRLRARLSTAPTDKAAWKAVKGDALTLAEAANLLIRRAPKEDRALWVERATLVRQQGARLFHAARKSDFPTSQLAYRAMISNCNQCHQKFADGEYQLEP